MASLTKRHFQQIAHILAKNGVCAESALVDDLKEFFLADNPRFDPWKFDQAIEKDRRE